MAEPLDWVVLLEACADAGASLLDRGTTEAVIRALADDSTIALHSPDRLALQLRVRGVGVPEALAVALERWRQHAQPSLPRGWSLVRAEIVSKEEFDREQ